PAQLAFRAAGAYNARKVTGPACFFPEGSAMNATRLGLVLLTLAGAAGPAAAQPDALARWEYRVLTRDQVLELGKKDLTAGLNRLGGDGWELVAIDTAYIFKRPGDRFRVQAEDLKNLVTFLET